MLMCLREGFCVWYPWGILFFMAYYLRVDPNFLHQKGAWQTLVIVTAIYPVVCVVCFSRVIKRRLCLA